MAESVDKFFGLYVDVEIMFAETVATAPVTNDPELWSSIHDFAKHRFELATRSSAPMLEASSWFVAAAKYGNRAQRVALVDDASKWCLTMPRVLTQAAALDTRLTLRRVIPPDLFGTDEVLAAAFLTGLSENDNQCLAVVKSLLQPVNALGPVRALVRPRALLLLERLGNSTGNDPQLLRRHLAKLRGNVDRLRDYRSENLLAEWSA